MSLRMTKGIRRISTRLRITMGISCGMNAGPGIANVLLIMSLWRSEMWMVMTKFAMKKQVGREKLLDDGEDDGEPA